MAKVSIVIPVYKVPERALRRCIESVLGQSLRDIEVLLVDDGSPRGGSGGADTYSCPQICDEYAEKDSRVIVIHKENGGLCSARNAGFLRSSGEYVMFVDGDDFVEPDMCREMYEKAIETGVQLVICSLFRDYGTRVSICKSPLEDGHIYEGEECRSLQQQVLDYTANLSAAYGKLFLRSFLSDGPILHDEALRQGAEDIEFNLRVFGRLKRAVYMDRPFYHYVYNENSISAAWTQGNIKCVLACFRKMKAYIDESEGREDLQKWFCNRLLYVICTAAVSGYFSPAIHMPYRKRVAGFQRFLKVPMVKEALESDFREGISGQRKAVLFAASHRLFLFLYLLGKLRRWQKGSLHGWSA